MILAVAGCGSSAPTKPDRLTPRTGLRVAEANDALAKYCVDQLRDGTGAIDQAYQSIQTLVEVFRADPHAIYRAGGPPRTMRQVLSDEASSLDSCDPEDAHQLDRALAAG